MRIHPGQRGAPAWRAQRCCNAGVTRPNAFLAQTVDVWRFDIRMPGDGETVVTEVIDQDIDDVRLRCAWESLCVWSFCSCCQGWKRGYSARCRCQPKDVSSCDGCHTWSFDRCGSSPLCQWLLRRTAPAGSLASMPNPTQTGSGTNPIPNRLRTAS